MIDDNTNMFRYWHCNFSVCELLAAWLGGQCFLVLTLRIRVSLLCGQVLKLCTAGNIIIDLLILNTLLLKDSDYLTSQVVSPQANLSNKNVLLKRRDFGCRHFQQQI